MLKSISQWAFPADMPMADRMALAADAGFEGIEVALEDDTDGSLAELGLLAMQDLERQAESIRATAAKYGLGVASVAAGILWGAPLTADDEATRQRGLEISAATLRAGRLLGVDSVLIIPGVVSAPFGAGAVVPYDVCYQRSVEAVKQLIPVAAEEGVKLGLEPVWNMFLLSPLEWAQYVDSFASEWVSVYFDVGNVLIFGYPEQWIRLLGPRISRVHVKDFRRSVGTINGFVDLLSGDVNWPAVVQALRGIGYDGWVTAEVMPPNPYAPEHLIHVTAQALDRVFAM